MKTLADVKNFLEKRNVVVEMFNGHTLYTEIGEFRIAHGKLYMNGTFIESPAKQLEEIVGR
jgi:hypothetical protein